MSELNYVNRELFDMQIIYSIDYSSIYESAKLTKKWILYHDIFSRDYYFVIPKSNPDYSKIMIDLRKTNLEFSENKYYFLINIPEISKSNEFLNEQAKKSRVFLIEKLVPFPFVILKDRRIYILAQYTSEVSDIVTKRILSVQNNYNNILGKDTFRIESIGSDILMPEEFMKFTNFTAPIYELKFKTHEPQQKIIGTGIFKVLSNDFTKNEILMKINNSFVILKYPEIETSERYVRMFRVASNLFNTNLGFILYNDIRCTGEDCIYTIEFEEDVTAGIMEVLSNLLKESIDLEIISYKKII